MEWFKKKSDEEVEAIIEEMLRSSKGNYITRSVSFNKNNPQHMNLLRKSVSFSMPFSVLVRGLLENFDETESKNEPTLPTTNTTLSTTFPNASHTPARDISTFT